MKKNAQIGKSGAAVHQNGLILSLKSPAILASTFISYQIKLVSYRIYVVFCLYVIDLGERDSLTSSVSEEENSDTMKTSEEVDFEKEFRPDDVGKEKNRTPEDT